MRSLPYLAGYVIPALSFLAIGLGGWWSFLTVGVAFGLIPLVELLLTGNQENPSPEQEQVQLADPGYDRVLFAALPVQYALLGFFLWTVSAGGLGWHELVGMTLAMGISCGVLGINVAHELGHRRGTRERNCAKLLLLTSLYQHFYIEHNRGHHARVATEADPASARYGEWLPVFLVRSLVGCYRHAWTLENDRLRKAGCSRLTWSNEMLRLQCYQLAAVAAVFALGGAAAGLAFLAAAATGALLLESVNYIEHYGLIRRRRASGLYERTLPIHSWNSNHTLGRLMLFELTRHSDHHADARRPYHVLRHFDESPQLPTGYPGMVVLAWIPPLFCAVMHRHIARYQACA